MKYQNNPKINTHEIREILKRKNPLILNEILRVDTYFFGFHSSSSLEMMCGAMKKVIWTLTTCMNMMNTHIL